MTIYFASDHAGYDLKNELLAFVRDDLHFDVHDCGAYKSDPADDYPAIISVAAQSVSRDVLGGIESRAIIFGASGQGEAIVANKFRGVRAVVYYGQTGTQTDASGKVLDMIASTRDHNNANVLSIGAKFVPLQDAKQVVHAWLSTPFSNEERHARRNAQIDDIAHD
jgi:ribose 5-phosphate isomerase B